MPDEIQMTIDAVREIANRTMGQMKGRAERSSRTFANMSLPASAFGGWSEAVELGRHHEAAQDVFLRTLEGVIADLETFEQNLRDTAESSERADEEVEAALLALGRGYQQRTFRSEQNYTESVEVHTGRSGVAAGQLEAEAVATQALADEHQVEPGTQGVRPDDTADPELTAEDEHTPAESPGSVPGPRTF